MYSKVFRYFLMVALIATTSLEIEATKQELRVLTNLSHSNKKEYHLQILNGAKTVGPNNKIAMIPLAVSVDEDGKIVEILDPDFITERYLQEINASIKDITLVPMEDDETPYCSMGRGCGCMGTGALNLVKGLGNLGAGTIVVAYTITSKTGKFLAVKTYTAASWLAKKIYHSVSEYYSSKNQAHYKSE